MLFEFIYISMDYSLDLSIRHINLFGQGFDRFTVYESAAHDVPVSFTVNPFVDQAVDVGIS